MLTIEVLNSYHGDKKVETDTSTAKGREKAAEVLNKMLRAGTAIFLERADRTYRITGYDAATDRLLVVPPGRWPLTKRGLPPGPEGAEVAEAAVAGAEQTTALARVCKCVRCDGCRNEVSGRSTTGVCSPCQQGRHGGKRKPSRRTRRGNRIPASYGGVKGRVRAVAPVAGG